jgi:hypothetical protein
MTIIHKADKRKAAAGAGAGSAGEAARRVDRRVANCLCCGRVFLLQDADNSDAKRLIGVSCPSCKTDSKLCSVLLCGMPT